MATFIALPPYGPGTAAVQQSPGGRVLRDRYTGDTTGSRRIDPLTKDFVMGSDGQFEGMPDVQQLVLIAVTTDKGSAAMLTLGHELRAIDRITTNFQRRVDATLRAAVQHLVNFGLIEVVAVSVETIARRPGSAIARLQWRDLATGLPDETLVGEPPHDP